MRFALVGNPNSGKTTLFNVLTGSTAHVGNWPGVTVDIKEGTYKKSKENVKIIDLPGIYSLSPYSPEEVVARNFLLEHSPELIINIVDATNLERNLYLTTQLLETDCPIIIALNMMDVVEKEGTKIDLAKLEKEIGVPVVSISALREEGIKNLIDKAIETAKIKRKGLSVLSYSDFKEQFDKIVKLAKDEKLDHPVFQAIKLFENDELALTNNSKLATLSSEIKKDIVLEALYEGDLEAVVANIRYTYITENYSKAFTRAKDIGDLSASDKIDKILTDKWLGIPVFLVLMLFVFNSVFGEQWLFVTNIPSPGIFIFNVTESVLGFTAETLSTGVNVLGAPAWLHGILIDGLVAGVFSVIGFLPQILLLFFFLALMEDTGYMARAAFIMDRILGRFGLSGKAFLPLLTGFGCSVPAIMTTRALSSEKERRLTMLVIPFFSCGAKFPIWAMFAGTLFGSSADLVIYGIYLSGIVTAGITAILLNRTILKSDNAPYIMELPSYHMPRSKNIALHLWDKMKHFLVRATTIIAGSTVVIWVFSNFNFSLQMVDANSAESMLGMFGNILRPVFIPLGFASGNDGWKAVVAILTGLIAKEMVVSSMGVLYNGSELSALEDSGAASALAASIAATFTPIAAISFMLFNLLAVPCMAAVAAMHSEMKNKKWTAIAIIFWLSTAWIVSFLVYNIGTFLGIGVNLI